MTDKTIELKAEVYDKLVVIETHQQAVLKLREELNVLNQQIAESKNGHVPEVVG